jgi:hypothetical protein
LNNWSLDETEPFKMKRFKSIPAKININELESHPADTLRDDANRTRTALPDKYFVNHNSKMIRTI